MEKKDKFYRMLLAGGVFLTAVSLSTTLVLSDWVPSLAAAVLFTGVAVYGAWKVWLIKDHKEQVLVEQADRTCQDPLVRSLASALSASYIKCIDGLSDGERVFVSGYLTLAILHTVRKSTLFNKSACCDLLSQGCKALLAEIQACTKSPLLLVWEMEAVPVEDVLADPLKRSILDQSAEVLIKNLKISE